MKIILLILSIVVISVIVYNVKNSEDLEEFIEGIVRFMIMLGAVLMGVLGAIVVVITFPFHLVFNKRVKNHIRKEILNFKKNHIRK